MKRIAWICFAHLLLFLAPGANARGPLQTLPAPGTFTGAVLSSDSIEWSWDPVLGSSTTLGASRYELQAEGTNEILATFPGPGSGRFSFVESGLRPGNAYCRHVVAFSGAESASTADLCVTIQAGDPCTLKGDGPTVVRAAKKGKEKDPGSKVSVEFRASPGGGSFITPPTVGPGSKGSIEVKEVAGLTTDTLMVVEVTGKKASRKPGDAQFTVQYRCKDGTIQSAPWVMTVLGDSDKALSLTAFADPSEPGSVPQGIQAGANGNLLFKAYSGTDVLATYTWTSISDDGAPPAKGDVTAAFSSAVTSSSVSYTVDGVAQSKAINDVIVTATVTATATDDGAPVTATAKAYRQWTVLPPIGGMESMCKFKVTGSTALAVPRNQDVFADVTFEEVAVPGAQLRWSTVTGSQPNIRLQILDASGGPTLRVRVIAQAANKPTASSASGELVITANYICTEGAARKNGSAIHAMTIYNLREGE